MPKAENEKQTEDIVRAYYKKKRYGTMKCLAAVVIAILEHPVVSALIKATISIIKTTLKQYPIWSAIFVVAFVISVIFAIVGEVRGVIGAGIVA